MTDKKALRKELNQRTRQQNRALHLWLRMISIELNMSGQTVKLVLAKTMDIDWDLDGRLAKELLWRKCQKVVLGKTSTTELTKIGDIDQVFDTLNRFLGEKFGVHCPWPTEEQLRESEEATRKLNEK